MNHAAGKTIGSLVLFLALCFMQTANAATWYVAMTGSDSNPGTQTQPFLTIGHAVTASVAGDTVLVADGTYTGAGNRNIDFGGIDRTVQSASGNPAACILDCQSSGSAFYLHSGETANSNIKGFTITNGTGHSGSGGGVCLSGAAATVTNCLFINNAVHVYGGGMYGGTAINCTFTGNSTWYGNGDGMYNGTAINCLFTGNAGEYGTGCAMVNGTATNCTFTGNAGGGLLSGTATNCTFTNNSGGGMSGTATNCTFTNNPRIGMSGTATNCTFINNSGGGMSGIAANCTFIGNSSTKGGGLNGGTATNCTFINNSATNGNGGGMVGTTATNCTFIGNTAAIGGGLYAGTATNCTFINNSATSQGGGTFQGTETNCIFTGNVAASGGGMYNGLATNCVLIGNSATDGGGVMNAHLYFCTLANNTALSSGGGIAVDANWNASVTNCIFWNNRVGASLSSITVKKSGRITPTYCDIQGGYFGTGNVDTDPLFVNQTTGNVHLTAASPCIGTATATPPVIPANPLAFPATDLDGGKRLVGSAPDMGAYEFGNVGVSGTLTFPGISLAATGTLLVALPQNVSFQFRPVGGGTTIAANYFTTADGAFSLYGIPNGSYNLWIKSPTYLAAVVPVTVSGGAASVPAATLQPGDANNDNVVDTLDFDVLIGAFGNTYDPTMPNSATGYDPTADFNGDGNIDTLDFNLLVGSYGTSGAP